MANIKFDAETVMKYKNKTGMYSQAKKPVIKINTRMTDLIVAVIENAFREYARGHVGCTLEMENTEWKRFLSKLNRHL